MPTSHGKRYRSDIEKVPAEPVSVADAVACIQGFAKTKFDQTVELVLHLGIDPKQADQALRGAISLPHGVGATKRVIAFCEGPDVEAAIEAGAIEAGGADLIKKVQGGWLDFDVAIAVPQMMRNVSRLGRVLGPQGKMPSPKSGTVTPDVAKAVTEYSAGKLEFRNDSGGNLAVAVGKVSFDAVKLIENAEFFIDYVQRIKPATTKGTYFKKACLTATMSPAVLVDVR